MGIYDRDYYREQRPSFSIRAPSTIVGVIILINVALYLANGLFTPKGNQITELLSAHGDTLTKPWMWWQLLTYGFVHSPDSLSHILFNMLGLWFLGREVELHYGRQEFLRLYLVLLVVGALVWSIGNRLHPAQVAGGVSVLGASGAVVGVVILFALNFPRRTLLLFFVLPVPAWLVGVLVVVSDLQGVPRPDSNVSYTVHLGGAAFAFLYYQFGWNLTRLTGGGFSLSRLKPRPKLRIHDPVSEEAELSAEVDRILEKIHREGEGSLTRKERRKLEDASRTYQNRRRG